MEGRTIRGVYILPNLITTGGMFFGFFAVMAGLTGQFEKGALAIIAAGIFDGLDGRVARATGSVSAFGKEYDSLADFLSFGMAPAVLIYQWALTPFERVGWAGAFLFTMCGALRLARFNVQQSYSSHEDQVVAKRYFHGLPIPAAAAILSATLLFFHEFSFPVGTAAATGATRWVPLIEVYLLGILMVSTIRFRSMKDFSWHRKRPFLALVAVTVFITVLTIHMAVTLFAMGLAYLLSAWHSHREYLRLLAEGKEEEEDEVKDLSM